MGIQECKRKHTSSEFVDMIADLENEWKEHDKIEYYLARIALKIQQAFGTDKDAKLTVEDFLMKFLLAGEKSVDEEKDKLDRAYNSYHTWMSIFAMNERNVMIAKLIRERDLASQAA